MRVCFSVLLTCILAYLPAQSLAGERNRDPGVLVGLSYGPFSSAGDLGDRFGRGFAIGGSVDYMPGNSNWQFGVLAQYGFGSEVEEDVLAGIRSSAGFLIGNQRDPADINLRQRQLFIGPRLGYTIGLGDNERAGIHLTGAIGYFYSRIRIQQDPVQFTPPVAEELLAGYDRLAGGPATYVFAGYQQLALDGMLNFFAGAEVTAAFTRPLRSFDLATGMPPPDGGRTDLVLGFRAGIIVPLYAGEGRDIYY